MVNVPIPSLVISTFPFFWFSFSGDLSAYSGRAFFLAFFFLFWKHQDVLELSLSPFLPLLFVPCFCHCLFYMFFNVSRLPLLA